MITLIGTGHVFNLSQAILDVFEKKQPEIVCVELDNQRYHALMLKKNDTEKYKKIEKNVPILYKILARFQGRIAKEYGVIAGEEMITAIDYAQRNNLPVELIDMNAQVIFTKMLKSMKFSERIKLFLTGIGGFFISKGRVEKELDKFEDDLDKYIAEIGGKFPTIKRVLIDERNEFMTQRLVDVNQRFKNIVALVGDGHIPGITKLLNDKNMVFETIRLSELRNQKELEYDSSTASFNINYKEP